MKPINVKILPYQHTQDILDPPVKVKPEPEAAYIKTGQKTGGFLKGNGRDGFSSEIEFKRGAKRAEEVVGLALNCATNLRQKRERVF